MSAAEVNIPLLRKAVEWAEAEAAKPRELCEWVQSDFVVPLSAEHAYSTGLLCEGTWNIVAAKRAMKAPECGTCYCIAGFVAEQGDEKWNYGTASYVARTALGISPDQADDLFSGGNTIADVRRIAEDIAGERL